MLKNLCKANPLHQDHFKNWLWILSTHRKTLHDCGRLLNWLANHNAIGETDIDKILAQYINSRTAILGIYGKIGAHISHLSTSKCSLANGECYSDHFTSHYPQSNRKAESALKSTKKLICAAWNGNHLNKETWYKFLLQYRNTPSRKVDYLLYGKPVPDTLLAHRHSFSPEWQRIIAEVTAKKV